MGPFEELVEAVVAGDIAKSLHSLVKYNQGLWKSLPQARFLMKSADELRNDIADTWANKLKEYDPKEHVAFHATSQLGYARSRRDKVRFLSWFFLLDGYGVVLRAKGKVQHAAGDRETQFLPQGQINWTRPEGTTGDVFFSLNDEKNKQEAARRKQAKENQPLIDKIKTIPGWEHQDILQDFVTQLEMGRTLSPRQMAVVTKKLPRDQLPTPDDPKKALQEFYSAVTQSLVPAWVKVYTKAGYADRARDLKQSWERFTKSSSFPPVGDHWVFDDLWQSMDAAYRGNLFRDTPGSAGVAGSVFFFTEMKDQVERSTRPRPTKKSLNWVNILPLYTKLANKVTPAVIEKELF